MSRFTRRTFLAGSAAAPALAQRRAEVPRRRNLLAAAWPPEKLASALAPRERFRPFPPASDRAAWEALPGDARAAFIEAGVPHLGGAWPSLPATLFLEYARIGNRSHYEAARSPRRDRLQALTVAECCEGRGRFVDEILNGIWTTCEESYWGLPAHIGGGGKGLPDVASPVVDLFNAETAAQLAWTLYLLGPQFDRISPLVRQRIELEMQQRMLTPTLERDFGWMGFGGRSVNNWNPWIVSNWLTSNLLLEKDEKRRLAAVHKGLRVLDNFLDSYHDDGGCDEGPGYWNRAGASLFDCLELLYAATGGAINLFEVPLVAEIGRYIYRAHIHNDWFTNFADAAARVEPSGDLLYRFGKRIHDENMMALGGFFAFRREALGLPRESLGRQIPGLFNLATLRTAPRRQPLIREAWMPGIQVITARVKEGSPEGLYMAAQGGHNAESHNHNDVGNFMVYANGEPAIIDVGVETYSAKTFSSRRYEIWTMQSAFHNCPTIDGVMQSAGRQFEATEVSHRDGEVRMNIARAYPAEAGIDRWYRTLKLDRGRNEVVVVDEYALRKQAMMVTLTLMTPGPVAQPAAGKLVLGNRAAVLYDAAVFRPAVEEIKLEDSRLRRSWGNRIFRILLQAEKPAQQGAWTTRIVRG
jgi:hypothetical protein